MIYFMSSPQAGDILAAYRPILLEIFSDQAPSGALFVPPVVYADIYFDDVYYSTVSVTVPDFIFFFGIFTIDISEEVQKYLNSDIVASLPKTLGPGQRFSAKCKVKIRQSYEDGNGLTHVYGSAPKKGTKYSSPVSGTGSIETDDFYVVNSALQHEDNQNLVNHLYFGNSSNFLMKLTHRPNGQTNHEYKMCSNDYDWIAVYPRVDDLSGIRVVGRYDDGSLFVLPTYNYPNTIPTNTTGVLGIGPKNLETIFPTIDWSRVSRYIINFVMGSFFDPEAVNVSLNSCCCSADKYVRVFFLNTLGGYDGINLSEVQIVQKPSSKSYERSLPNVLNHKRHAGVQRRDVDQVEVYEAITYCYQEQEMEWLKELVGSPRAYIQWKGKEEQTDDLIPIRILDAEQVTRKATERYSYGVKLTFELSNHRINLNR